MSKKYTFRLSNIDMEKIDQKYNISLVSNISNPVINPLNTTKISELNSAKIRNESVNFLDESKKNHICSVSMIDFASSKDINILSYNCYWCRNPFDTQPIGCPIRYISDQAVKRYRSEISRDVYTIKENVTSRRGENIEDTRININKKDYYLTDGVFCSFNCCRSFIKENKHDSMYNTSDMLLLIMYNKSMNTKNRIIDFAPHWRMLSEYGGNMSITEFRNSFTKTDYNAHGIVNNLPEYHSIGVLFEEMVKF